ncbi:hypothetical protein WH50_03410 [Pokkaliibacter plantistimulans]|uniref:Uncharacterized protein n=1 Tax=Pokkaliibacter plantistimulans TaxID=1635171 RepID=A0ABX5M4Y2_9GAMM|nr:hypothetical protein [Pokkaliibacter plantistimulans]PXF32638.1 hypothetical protein WH50_03410 [Pokkaliibacter plantistimulans]
MTHHDPDFTSSTQSTAWLAQALLAHGHSPSAQERDRALEYWCQSVEYLIHQHDNALAAQVLRQFGSILSWMDITADQIGEAAVVPEHAFAEAPLAQGDAISLLLRLLDDAGDDQALVAAWAQHYQQAPASLTAPWPAHLQRQYGLSRMFHDFCQVLTLVAAPSAWPHSLSAYVQDAAPLPHQPHTLTHYLSHRTAQEPAYE